MLLQDFFKKYPNITLKIPATISFKRSSENLSKNSPRIFFEYFHIFFSGKSNDFYAKTASRIPPPVFVRIFPKMAPIIPLSIPSINSSKKTSEGSSKIYAEYCFQTLEVSPSVRPRIPLKISFT